MLNKERKTYEAPTLKILGDMKDITESGNQSDADTLDRIDGTAFEVFS